MKKFLLTLTFALALGLASTALAQTQTAPTKPRPKVIVIGVNGMEMDIIRPLMIKGELPNLSSVVNRGAYGKLRTVNMPNCPRVYSTIFTSTQPEEHGVRPSSTFQESQQGEQGQGDETEACQLGVADRDGPVGR